MEVGAVRSSLLRILRAISAGDIEAAHSALEAVIMGLAPEAVTDTAGTERTGQA